jgi:hypothetical protein
MKLRGPTEHAIYAAMFTTRLGNELGRGVRPEFTNGRGHVDGKGAAEGRKEWERWCAHVAIGAAETAVTMHRDAVRRRKAS